MLFISCGGSKKAANAVSSGNYHQAFDLAIANLSKDKSKSSNQKNIPILKEAYQKALQKDTQEITFLEKNLTKNNLQSIYQKYLLMDIRQDEVKALQPLYFEGQEYTFSFKDYTKKTARAKRNLSKYLYDESRTLLLSTSKEDARLAHKNLEILLYDLSSDYKSDIQDLLNQATIKASSFVLVTLNNKINNQLQDSTSRSEIANFKNINTSNFNNPWVIYHDKKDTKTNYDYSVNFTLDKLQFIPEKLNTEIVAQKKRVQDGLKYTYDAKGNVMNDKEGNDIKEAKYVDVTAEVQLFQQVKSATVNGSLTIKNYKTGAIINTNPLTGEAKLENVYAKYRGDQRAIEEKYYDALNKKEAQFPADEVFKKYALDNLKKQALGILNQQKF
jgi:hypothetical protein